VYWVRRAIVLLVILVLLVGLIWWLGGRGGGDGTATAAPTTSAEPTGSTSPEPTESPTTDPSGSASPTTTKAAKCADSAIKVTASTDAASYAVGATPLLRMQIENKSDTACRRDVGADANELIVNLGETRFWSSDDCNPAGKSDVVTLESGQTYSVSLTWLGRASEPDCPADQPAAEAGSYNLVGRNGDVLSKPEPFSLT
jgi:hypothetical protein